MLAAQVRSPFNRTVYFSVGERFVAAVVPAPSAKDAESVCDFLLKIRSKPILDGALVAMGGDVGSGIGSGAECIDRLAVAAHIGVVDVGEQTQDAFSLAHERVPQLEFEIL